MITGNVSQMSRFFMTSLIILIGVLASHSSLASTIEFPEDELATESVYPVFDQPTAVKKRNVVLDGKMEFAAFGGVAVNDPFVSPLSFGGTVGYHFSDEHSVHLLGSFMTRTPSQYVEPLQRRGQDYSYAPAVTRLLMAVYRWSPYYGKISITKQSVLNIGVNLQLGVGTVAIQNENKFACGFGIGQDFYFSPRWGLKADLLGYVFQGPDAVSVSMPYPGTKSAPENSSFEQKIQTNFSATLGVIFLL